MTQWFEEKLHRGIGMRLEALSVLYEAKTDHQHLVVFEHALLGRVMMLDGIIQTTERDEFVYHEMLSHVPILAHGSATRVLIVGGGDGGMLEEVLKHPGVEKATLVEIDRAVIDIAETYFRSICGDAFDDPRTDLVIGDGLAFMREAGEAYDVIVIDSTDPVGPGEVLFTAEFYADCKTRLAPGGVLVTQNGVPFFQGAELAATMERWRPHFLDAGCYLAAVPMYMGGFMALGWATDDRALRNVSIDTLATRFAASGIATSYYTPAVHKAAFALPPFISGAMQG